MDEISIKRKYKDDHGQVIVVGFVKHYVVWRRPGAAANVSTLNEFSKRFREATELTQNGEVKAAGR